MRNGISALFAAFLTFTAAAPAQQTPPAPQGGAAQGGRGRGQTGPTVVSPQVNADRTVTLRQGTGRPWP